MRPTLALALFVLGCSSTPAPAPAPRRDVAGPGPSCPPVRAPPAPEATRDPGRQPVELTLEAAGGGYRTLSISFHPPLPDRWRSGDVESIRLDDVAVFPPDCTTSKVALCSLAHRELRGEGERRKGSRDTFGKGGALQLLEHETLTDRAFALFSAGTHGSSECGTYAFWILRLDASGVRVTAPLEGCFLSPSPKGAPEGSVPVVAWSDPPILWVANPAYDPSEAVQIYTLDDRAMTFSRRVGTKNRVP